MNQLIEQKFLALFEQQWGKKADRTEMLPASGSARKYWRIYWNGESCIAAWNRNVEENRLFIDFSRHFAEKGLNLCGIGRSEGLSTGRFGYANFIGRGRAGAKRK